MPDHYAAFLSYAHRYQPWVKVLQTNLEAGFEAAGRPDWRVFLDNADLASGRSWVGRLQAALDQADHMILVVTPEALASPRVIDEWQSFLAIRPDWHNGKLHLVHLIETPLPPFLSQIQFLDFREAGDTKYRRGLQQLLSGLFGQADQRHLPMLPNGIKVPVSPDSGLPSSLRSRLVDCLAPLLNSAVLRSAISHWLDLGSELEGQPSSRCAASAALVRATKADDPVAAALRILETIEERLRDEQPDRVAAFGPLREELSGLRQQGSSRGLLAYLLHQVAADHEQLAPYFHRQGDIELLDRVYVQLAIRPEARRAASRELSTKGLDRALSLREVLGLNRTVYPWITGRWVLLGDPGAGKTTLLRHFSALLARQEDRPWVPIFESLPRLVREGRPLLDRVARRLEAAGQPAEGLKAVLDREGQQGRLLVLLDGLDEVPRDQRERAEQLLRDIAFTWPNSPLVVTSRPIGYHPLGSEFHELSLLPLDIERQREFFARWFGRATGQEDDTRAQEALAILNRPELIQLTGNPLYITLMALLFEQGKAPDLNHTRLYDQVFEVLLEGKHRLNGIPIEHPEAVRQALRHLALAMTAANREAEPLGLLERQLYEPEADAIRLDLQRVPRWRQGLLSFFDDVALTGILAPHDGPNADWRFWHRTFREALVAELLANEYTYEDGRESILARARELTEKEDLSRWAQPFALLVGRVADPDELGAALVAENRPLGLRALATAQRLRDDTLRDILFLTERWEQRREVYLGLPELLDDPHRVLSLLDQLRRSTRNGNDLFFIDLVAQRVSSSPDHARDLANFRTHLYDHIPRPQEDLFRRVETPHDGQVPLWREIPAGRFRMGSLEGEAERDAEEHDEERPCHEVTLTRPFLCGVVPVTQAQYDAFDPEHCSKICEGIPEDEIGHHPVVRVTWYEAISFCRWLTSVFPWALGARLPVEEEWEYACRAGTQCVYWNGDNEDDLDQIGWYLSNASSRTHRVGEKPANPWGLYDVHGNVWEWTLGTWTPSYEGRAAGVTLDPCAIMVDPATLEATTDGGRVLRGGSYWNNADEARAACRGFRDPAIEFVYQGFRVVIPADTGGPKS